MIKYDELKYLAVTLPEDVQKEKWSGNVDEERKLIDVLLSDEKLPYAMRRRLEREKENIDVLLRCYTIPQEQALNMVREVNPSVTESEFARWRREGKMDWIYVNGKRMYSDSFFGTLRKVYPQLLQTPAESKKDDAVDAFIASLKDGEESRCHIHIRQELYLEDGAVEEGKKVRLHLPLPVERDQIENLKIIEVKPTPARLPEIGDHQPAAYFEDVARKGKVYSVEYSLENRAVYMDPEKIDIAAVRWEDMPKEAEVYLREELPHIQFTPYLRSLAEEIRGEEENPLLIARKVYDYVTTEVVYRFVRDYAGIDNISEYCAASRRGDCGVQALLFITLCRILGIPAKWQSGLDAKPNGGVGQHDWAVFYLPSVGWLYCDPSYGGAAYRNGSEKRWNYFFCNVDPYRIPHNDGFQEEFQPPKKFSRMDPYDNQSGEIEYEDHGVYGEDIGYRFIELDIHLIK